MTKDSGINQIGGNSSRPKARTSQRENQIGPLRLKGHKELNVSKTENYRERKNWKLKKLKRDLRKVEVLQVQGSERKIKMRKSGKKLMNMKRMFLTKMDISMSLQAPLRSVLTMKNCSRSYKGKEKRQARPNQKNLNL